MIKNKGRSRLIGLYQLLNRLPLLLVGLFCLIGAGSSVMGQAPAPDFTVIPTPQLTTMPEIYKSAENMLLFDPSYFLTDIKLMGKSYPVEFEAAFLNLNQSQKNEYIKVLEEMADYFKEGRSFDYKYRHIMATGDTPENEKKIEELEKALDTSGEIESKHILAEIKNILGEEKYYRLLDWKLWMKFYTKSGNDEKQMAQDKDWVQIDRMNDQALQDAGIVNGQLRRNCLKIMYQHYKAYFEAGDQFRNLNINGANQAECSKIVEDFKVNRENLRTTLKGLLKEKADNEKVKNRFIPILETN